jgi:hypothetical protein
MARGRSPYRGSALAKRIVQGALLLLVLLGASLSPVDPPWSGGGTAPVRTAQADTSLAIQHSLLAIHDAALRYGISEAWLDRIAWCESGTDPFAVGDGGLAIGIYQWHEQTWDSWALPIDIAKGRQNSWAAAYETARAIAAGHASWWTCA